MTSKRLVIKTLEFDAPERIPRQLWTLPWAEKNHPEMLSKIQKKFPDDIISAPVKYKKPLLQRGGPYKRGTYIDEWGCTFTNLQDGIIGIVKNPLIKDWQDLEYFKVPWPRLEIDRETINRFCQQTDKFVLANAAIRPFERLGFIRTMEAALMDLWEQSKDFFELLTTIHSFYLKEVELWASTTQVDAICLSDDWGTQTSLMISPDLWRTIFKPLYQEYIEIARSHNKYVFMHSDGFIYDIIPDLMEIGIDALNSQIFCMGVKKLGKAFGGKITFWGEVDRQNLLSNGSPRDIRMAVQEISDYLNNRGGVIAQCEFGPGANPKNVYEVFKAWDTIKPSHSIVDKKKR
jgi:hypothetical protein